MTKIKKVFISGEVSEIDREIAVERFKKAKELLMSMGYHVFSPLDFVPEGASWHESMNTCLSVLKICNVIYMLKGYENSRGACVEYRTSQQKGIEIIYQ